MSHPVRTNILFVLPTLNIGGTQIKLLRIVQGLDSQKFNPVICCFRSGGTLFSKPIAQNLNIYVLNRKRKLDVRIICDILKIIRKEKIDVVHTFIGGNAWGRIAGIIGRVKVIIATEESLRLWQKWYDLIIARALAIFTDIIICNSEATKNIAVRVTGISEDKFTVIYNSVNISAMDKIKPDRTKILDSLGLYSGSFIVACLSRFEPRKGHENLIRAMKYLRDHHSGYDVKLLLLAEGPSYNLINDLVVQLELSSHIRFLGYRNDALEILAISDLLVLPSLEEGFGNTLIEAMALSTPTIGTSVGGIPEVIEDGMNGVLVAPENPEELAMSIVRIIEDNAFTASLIDNGRNIVREKFSDEIIFQQYEELYSKLLSHK